MRRQEGETKAVHPRGLTQVAQTRVVVMEMMNQCIQHVLYGKLTGLANELTCSYKAKEQCLR